MHVNLLVRLAGTATVILFASGCKTDVGRAVDNVEEYIESCEELIEALDEVNDAESAKNCVKHVKAHLKRVEELNDANAKINPSPEQIGKIKEEIEELDVDGVHGRLQSAMDGAFVRSRGERTLGRALDELAGTGFQFRGTDRVSD